MLWRVVTRKKRCRSDHMPNYFFNSTPTCGTMCPGNSRYDMKDPGEKRRPHFYPCTCLRVWGGFLWPPLGNQRRAACGRAPRMPMTLWPFEKEPIKDLAAQLPRTPSLSKHVGFPQQLPTGSGNHRLESWTLHCSVKWHRKINNHEDWLSNTCSEWSFGGHGVKWFTAM